MDPPKQGSQEANPQKPPGSAPLASSQADVRFEKGSDKRLISGRLLLHEKGVELPLPQSKPVLVIGRADPVQNIYPDIDLAELDGEKSGVSRRHARIILKPDGIFIEDLNSTNFTFLNRVRLEPGRPYPLNDGDELRLGVLTLEFRK